MSSRKVLLNTEWLSVCGGCHVAIVDLHEKIIEVLGAVDILRCPVLTDTKTYPEADIGIVTGAIRSDHDRQAAERMRRACKLIIAFGTCAVYGGISGASLAHTPEDILETVYLKSRTTRTKTIPRCQLPRLERRVVPINEVIDVDLSLPGCPPHPKYIFEALHGLLENRSVDASQETVCAHCGREMVERGSVDRILMNHEGIPASDICLMSQGYLCLGSVTLDRCLAPCPQNGVVCTGCCGPTMQILAEPNRDIRTEVAERMSYLTGLEEQEVIAAIESSAKSHYAYAMCSAAISGKPTFLLERWIAAVESGR